MADLSTVEREAMERAVAADGFGEPLRRRVWLAARAFYGPERVAVLGRDLNEIAASLQRESDENFERAEKAEQLQRDGRLVIDTVLSDNERREWHSRLENPETWLGLKKLADGMLARLDSRIGRTRMADRKEHEVGRFTAAIPIVVRPQIEVGITWEAEAQGLGLAAIGPTPQEAVRSLFRSIGGRGISGYGNADDKILAKLAARQRDS